MIINKFLALVLVVLQFAGCLKIVTFGDSSLENNGCNSDLLGVPFPPSPPYSEFNRYSSNWSWVDYLDWELSDVEIISCACGGALATQDFSWDPLNTGTSILVPGLLTQINTCSREKNLKQLCKNEEELIAIIQIGGNDFFQTIVQQITPPLQQFSDVLRFAVQNLTEIGFNKIYIGTLNTQIESPLIKVWKTEQSEAAVKLALQIQSGFSCAFEEVAQNLMNERYPVTKIPRGQFLMDIQQEAQRSGLEAFQPCVKPLTLWSNLQVLPDCTEFNKRVWFDGTHLADWAHQQYAKRMIEFLDISA